MSNDINVNCDLKPMVYKDVINISSCKSDEGRIYEGIGAVSAGGPSRLFTDYPPEVKEQLLDYLFKPNFGASLQELKVETGGEVPVIGAEPAYARTREEFEDAVKHIHDPYYTPNIERFNRGYEWELMKCAKERNPDIILECLQWGAPGWIGGPVESFKIEERHKRFYSQDNIDFIIAFINGAKTYHDLEIAFTGVCNENVYTKEQPDELAVQNQWIKDFSKAVAANNAANNLNTRVVAPDFIWNFADELVEDSSLKDAIAAMVVHYPSYTGDNETARNLKKADGSYLPLWSGEDGVLWRENNIWFLGMGIDTHWLRGMEMARKYNRNYIKDKITRTETYITLCSQYDNLQAPRVGMITANQPWSGYYDVLPTLWAAAHTTQFAQPGWIYVDGPDTGSGMLLEDGKEVGSYVTLKNPQPGADDKYDYSIVIETTAAVTEREFKVRLSGDLSQKALDVWYTNMEKQFIKADSIKVKPEDDQIPSFTITLKPGHIYSLTTTTGQCKGSTAAIPSPSPFPVPYIQDFEALSTGKQAPYFADFQGIFEVAEGGKDGGKCLRQQVPQKPIHWIMWEAYKVHEPTLTYLGEMCMADYELSADVFIENEPGDACLYGRIGDIDIMQFRVYNPYISYYLKLTKKGVWSLHRIDAAPVVSSRDISVPVDETLAAGTIENFKGDEWHNLKLVMLGTNIRALIDYKEVCNYTDGNTAVKMGFSGVGSSELCHVRFDNFRIDSISCVTAKVPGNSTINNIDGYAGMKITVGKSPILVKELGRYYIHGNNATHNLKIAAMDGTTIADADINLSEGTASEDGFKYVTLSEPVYLEAGTSYFIGSLETSGGDEFYNCDTELTTTSSITINDAAYTDSEGNWCTKSLVGRNNSYGPVNFRYVTKAKKSLVTFVETGYDNKNSFTGEMGMKIHVNNTIDVREFGKYYIPNSMCKHEKHTMRIVDAQTYEQVGEHVEVDMNSGLCSTDCYGGFIYGKAVKPITLEAGHDYYVLVTEEEGKDWHFGGSVLPRLESSKDASVICGVRFNGEDFSENSDPDGGNCYGPVNFLY